MSDSVRPHRRQPTRLPRLWDSPSKNNGVGCHFLLQCMKVKSESEVAQSCPTLSDPMTLQPSRLLHYGIFQARVLEWGAIAFSKLVDLKSFLHKTYRNAGQILTTILLNIYLNHQESNVLEPKMKEAGIKIQCLCTKHWSRHLGYITEQNSKYIQVSELLHTS